MVCRTVVVECHGLAVCFIINQVVFKLNVMNPIYCERIGSLRHDECTQKQGKCEPFHGYLTLLNKCIRFLYVHQSKQDIMNLSVC